MHLADRLGKVRESDASRLWQWSSCKARGNRNWSGLEFFSRELTISAGAVVPLVVALRIRTKMQRIQQQFGDKLAILISASPTLTRDLKLLRDRRVRIRRLHGQCRAYSRSHPGQKEGALICISVDCSPIQQAHYLAHEAFHILAGKTPHDFNPLDISRAQYVRMAINEEASCLAHELKVSKELHDAGYFIGAANLSWLVDYLLGGLPAIKRRLKNTSLSVSNLTYAEYYGWLYDRRVQEIAQEKRGKESRTKRTA